MFDGEIKVTGKNVSYIKFLAAKTRNKIKTSRMLAFLNDTLMYILLELRLP